MKQLGFKDGDKIISINNQPVKDINKISIDIVMNPNTIIKINRNNDYQELKISSKDAIKILHSKAINYKS
ncbi:hypothetical protein [Flavobacterium croceum]|uniref:hypothetical protein n=1 Tax=Flavobacterium croceum TaxID=370975 RepID=UPI0024A9226C|nr:hypothetical protein [Flavobacterium croceum]